MTAEHHPDARRLVVVGTLIATLALAVLGASSETRAGDSDAMRLYLAARARWNASPVPTDLTYDVAIDGTHGRDVFRDRFHVRYRVADRKSLVTTLEKTGTQPPFEDTAHQPVFPDDTFGFVDRLRTGAAAKGDDDPARLPYVPAIVARERIGEHEVVHLRMTPRLAGDRAPIRDAWIDPQTNEVVRLRALGKHRAGPVIARVDLLLDYADAPGGYRLIRTMQAHAVARVLFAPYEQLGRAVFADVRTPRSLPDVDATTRPSENGVPLAPPDAPPPG